MAAAAAAFAWASFPAMPTQRVYCSAVHHDGQLFVLGGCGGSGRPLGAAEVLDLPAQRWTTLPPLPTPRAGAAALAVGKQILVVGGVDASQSPLASVEVYNVDEGKWEKKAALAQPSMGISAVQRDGAVYALGGMGADTSPQALVRVYEPAKDHWQPLPSMPTPCYGASAFLQGNKIFVLGGRQGKLPVTAFEAFDLETRSWTRYPSVPSRRAFAGCAMAEGVVFSLGGLQQPGPHNFYSRPHFVNTVEMFDPAQGAWSKPSRAIRMREKRADFVAGYLGGRVVAVGGLARHLGKLLRGSRLPLPSGCWHLPPSSLAHFPPAPRRAAAPRPSPSRGGWVKATSRARWTRWKASASRGRSGSRCRPCPPAAAPAAAARRPASSSSSAAWPRAPAAPSRPCACARRPERRPGDRPQRSTKCLKSGTGWARARASSLAGACRAAGSRGGRTGAGRAVPCRAVPCHGGAGAPEGAARPCRVCSSACRVVVDPVDVSCSAEVPCSSVPRR